MNGTLTGNDAARFLAELAASPLSITIEIRGNIQSPVMMITAQDKGCDVFGILRQMAMEKAA